MSTEREGHRQNSILSKRKRRVNFHSDVIVRIIAKNQHQGKNLSEYWYSRQEMNDIHKANLKAISLFKQSGGLSLSPMIERRNGDSVRGLEFAHHEERSKKSRRKRQSIKVVLQEQEVQRQRGIFDPDAIAVVYLQTGIQSMLDALSYRKRDEQDVVVTEERTISNFVEKVHDPIKTMVSTVDVNIPKNKGIQGRRQRYMKMFSATA